MTYYDFRNNTPAAAVDRLLYGALPPDVTHGMCRPRELGDEQRLTDMSFDMRQAPFAGGFFTGDYEGLTTWGPSGLLLAAPWHRPVETFSSARAG